LEPPLLHWSLGCAYLGEKDARNKQIRENDNGDLEALPTASAEGSQKGVTAIEHRERRLNPPLIHWSLVCAQWRGEDPRNITTQKKDNGSVEALPVASTEDSPEAVTAKAFELERQMK
jgi:hypothetical protein